MEPARTELAAAIEATEFKAPICPVYQNVSATPFTNPAEIKENLVAQLTAPVKWTQTVVITSYSIHYTKLYERFFQLTYQLNCDRKILI